MRVIEDRCPFSNTAMGKKRKNQNSHQNHLNHAQCDTSDDADNSPNKKACSHVAKAVKLSNWKKMVKPSTKLQCAGCLDDSNDTPIEEGTDNSSWFCLQCGTQGCGELSKNHIKEHWKKPHSDSHCIAVNTTRWNIRCFECDDTIPITSHKSLGDTVSYLKKQLGVGHASRPNSAEISQMAPESTTGGPQATVDKPGSGGAKQKQRGGGEALSGGTSKTAPKLKGLSNLGNTCFFNAVMQSLSQVRELNQLLSDKRQGEMTIKPVEGDDSTLSAAACDIQLSSDYESSGEEDNDCPDELHPLTVKLCSEKSCSTLTDALIKLLRDMTSEEARHTLNPGGLFSHICSKVPRFKGYQQQDSHELLRYLLDAMKNEEQKRIQSGILSTFNYKSLDESAKKECAPQIKLYGQHAKHTTVDSLFGGHLLSSVQCNECHKASQIFEPFLDLSLPIYEEKTRHIARKGSRSTADDNDDFIPAEERNGPSKHQQKKAAKATRRNKKLKNHVISKQDEVPENSAENNAGVEGGTSTEPGTETQATEPISEATVCIPVDDGDVKSMTSSADKGQLSDSGSSSVRSPSSPKSPNKSGYNSDIEDSELTGEATLIPCVEKLKIVENTRSPKIKDAIDTSLTPLSGKPTCAPHDCSVLSSLGQFTTAELLTGSNKFACSFCNRKAKKLHSSSKEKPKTVYTNAKKQLIIYSPPAILTLHLKRFQQNGYSFNKVNRHVDFSMTLDLAPYCSTLSQGVEAGKTSVKYLLFAVVEHSGRLNNGHYTAYVRQRSSNPKIIKMLQKSLYNRKPLTVILERFSEVGEQNLTADRVDGLASEPVLNGEVESNQQSRWYHISDTHVKEIPERTVLNSQAYLLFYERVP